MWKWTPKDGNQPVESFYPGVTHIGKSIAIKGEVSGTENVDVAGDLEGSVELLEGSITVGPEGHIRGNVQASSIVVHGRVDGNLYGIKRVELKKSAVLVGDICAPRIAIEEGASLKRKCAGRQGRSHPPNKEIGRPGGREIARVARIKPRQKRAG